MEAIQKLKQLREKSLIGGGLDKKATLAKQGKLSARERIQLLLDPNSFLEFDQFVTHDCQDFNMADKKILGDAVITGCGEISGRKVFIYSQDFTVLGGSLSTVVAKKICKVMDMAVRHGAPIIGINDSGGARIQEGVASLAGYADIFYRNVKASGVIPQISLIVGPCAGGAVYSPAITDFILMADHTSYMFITGPDVIKSVTGEVVTFEDLGGAATHTKTSGVADLKCDHEESLIATTRKLFGYIPSNNLDLTPQVSFSVDKDFETNRAKKLNDLIPSESNRPYNVIDVIQNIIDDKSFFELKPEFAPQIVTAFGRMAGQSVGIVANNPNHLAGVLDINASVKGARFIRFCDAFQIPLLVFEDVPGFLPGTAQEHGGIIRHGAKLLYAFAESTVPKLTIILRKAYGGAYCVMNSKQIGADFVAAWPNAELAVMGAAGACNIIFKNQIAEAKNSDEERKKLVSDYSDKFSNPYYAAEKGLIDAVILPEETRSYLIKMLHLTKNKREAPSSRKHGNIPL